MIKTAAQILAEIGDDETGVIDDRPLATPCRKTGRTWRVRRYPAERKSPGPRKTRFCSLGCGRKHKGLGYCEPHLHRFTTYGTPHGGRPLPDLPKEGGKV